MPVTSNALLARLLKRADLAFTVALFGTILLLVLPVPPFQIDVLLALSIGLSLLVLLSIVYVKDPPEFSGFPSILLSLTLFRLALNISSTRQILATGYAGEIIESFGHFVIQGNYVVGVVVFAILVLINFVVITKGAGRIAEVSARFTLDALPGKQMAIDAELNAGVIDDVTATQRRLKVQKEADFYGAMDGASKFVRGDAIAGILITLVNVLGGFAVGVFQMGLTLTESLAKFTLLSIGDGLVSQIPALIISIGAGLLVTRAADHQNLGTQITGQLFRYPRALGIGSGFMALFGLMPGMPLIPFWSLAGLAWYLSRSLQEAQSEPVATSSGAKAGGKSGPGAGPANGSGSGGGAAGATPSEDVRKLAEVDSFAIEIGFGLLPLAETKSGGDLLARVTGVRKTLAREKGLVIPPISVRDNFELGSTEYRFLLRGKSVASGTLMPGRFMAMNVGGSTVKLRGTAAREPVFNLDAVWIEESEKKGAEINGYTVVDPASVLITHLSEALKSHAHHLLSRQDVQAMVDHIKATQPALVAELLPDLVTLGLIQRVLQNLLREGVSILNLPLILEALADFASLSKNPDDLSELVRRRLGLYFVPEYEAAPGSLKAFTLDPRFEQLLVPKVHRSPTEVGLALDPATGRHLLEHLSRLSAELTGQGFHPVVVVSTEIRLPLRRFLEPSFPRLTVLAFNELPASTDLENAGIITVPPGAPRMPEVKLAA
jgi:flagellar biosynthesis protein FlhA